MPEIPEGAAEFFGSAESIDRDQKSLAEFEATCVRAVARHFNIPVNRMAEMIGEPPDTPLTMNLLDLAYPGFPIRLGSNRIKASKMGKKDRRPWQWGFHELRPMELFSGNLLKTQLVFRWRDLRDDGTRDGRPIGLIFPCVMTPYVIHNRISSLVAPGTRLIYVSELVKGEKICDDLVVEPLLQLLKVVASEGWRPNG